MRRALVLVAMFFSITYVAWHTGNKLNEYHQQEFQRNIDIVMEQNVDTVTSVFNNHITMVKGMAKRMAMYHNDPARLKQIVLNQANMQKYYGFVRLGFIYPDGTAFTSDGYQTNLSVREYFQQSLNGETVITETITNYLGDTKLPVNVISTPVKDNDNKIIGVVFETIPNELLIDIMSKNIFAELGSNVLVDDEGNVMAADRKSTIVEKYQDMFMYLTTDAGGNRNISWEHRIKGSNSDTMYFERDGGQFLHFAPLLIDQRIKPIYLAIVVDKSFLIEQTSIFSRNIYNRMLLIVFLTALGLGYLMWDMRQQYIANQHQLEKLAYRSRITKGDNFDKFILNVNQVKTPGYIVCMDIVDFAVVRSVFGVANANEILRKVWEDLTPILGPKDYACHVSSDYFALFLAGTDSDAALQKLRHVNILLADLSERERMHKMYATFGLAPFTPGDDPNAIYSNANLTKQSIPEGSETPYAFFGEKYTQNFFDRNNLESTFEENLKANRFEVWYQPKYDCFDGSIVGAEALLRLKDIDGKMIPPGKFIPTFEKDGLIRYLDEYVFRKVCQVQKARIDAGKKLIPVSINLSRVSLLYEHIAEYYANIAKDIGVPPECIPIEITESATVNVSNIAQLMHMFISYGFKLHMDDFGSGYSSFAALNSLPFENIKIDKSIIDYIGNEKGNKILRHIVVLASETQFNITAEGVETQEQVDYLKELNCHCVQGYYFSKPLEYSDFDKLLD